MCYPPPPSSVTVTCEQLEHEHTQGPIVCADVVAFVENDLRGHVLGGAAESPSLTANLREGEGRGGFYNCSDWLNVKECLSFTCNFFANPKSTSFT